MTSTNNSTSIISNNNDLRTQNSVHNKSQTNFSSTPIMTSTNTKSSVVDSIKAESLTYMPDICANLIPEDFVSFAANKNMLRNESIEQTLQKLPRKSDGKIDVEQLKAARKFALDFIRRNNKAALDKFKNYGIYKKQLNNIDPNVFYQTPELNHALKCLGLVDDHSCGYGGHDLLSVTATALDHVSDDGWLKDLADMMKVKSSQEITEEVRAQNAALDKLEKINLNTEDGIKQFLEGYKNVTGTSFSCDEIIGSEDALKDNNKSSKDKLNIITRNFGIQYNYINAVKNETSTNSQFSSLSMVSSTILNKCGPVGNIIGTALPFQIEYAELLTKGCKEGEFINWDNLTLESFCDSTVSALKTVVISKLMGGFFGDKFTKFTDTLWKRMLSRGAIGGFLATCNGMTKKCLSTIKSWFS